MPNSSGCTSVALPIRAAQVGWVGLVGKRSAPPIFALTGIMRAGTFEPRAVDMAADDPVESPPSRLAAPSSLDFPAHPSTRTFGVDERAPPKTGAPGREASPVHRRVGRAAWAWSAEQWRSHGTAFIARAKRWGISRLYVSIPITGDTVASPDLLARFIAAAARAGIEVWAVDGDPRAVLVTERGKFGARAAAYARYNAHVRANERIRGVQYDIEVYLDPDYQLDVAQWQKAYVATIRALEPAADMPIEVVLPFWLGQDPATRKRLLDPLVGHIAAVVVMDYRTNPTNIRAFAEPFLAWGAKTGTPIWVAFENGKIGSQIIRYFHRASAGEVWLVPVGGETAALYLHTPAAAPIGTAYAYDHDAMVPGSRVSFLGDTDRLRRTAASIEGELRASSAFAGIAFDGVF